MCGSTVRCQHTFAHRGGSMHVLCLHLCSLDFQTEPPFDYLDDDSGDAAFVKAIGFISGQDAVEEYLSSGIYLLPAGVGLGRITDGVTPVLRLKLPLLKFHVVRKDDEDDVQFLVRVELETEGVVGSYTRLELDVCMAGLPNWGRLNHVLELVGVPYGPRPVTGMEASEKRKMDATGKTPIKRAKASRKKKAETLKIVV
jgi:hypothetical protein